MLTRNRLIDFLIVSLLALVAGGCGVKGARHITTVSAVTAHAVLTAIDDTERLLVCAAPGAPAAPACIDMGRHKDISAKLATAFEADAKAARAIRDWPAGTAPPQTLGEYIAVIQTAIDYVLTHLPDGAIKAKLVTVIGGR